MQFEGGDATDAFTRISYTDAIAQPEDNALLPASSGTLTPAGNAFTDDTVGAEHSYAIYTTTPAATQVAMTPVRSEVAGGGQVQLGASVIDGTARPPGRSSARATAASTRTASSPPPPSTPSAASRCARPSPTGSTASRSSR